MNKKDQWMADNILLANGLQYQNKGLTALKGEIAATASKAWDAAVAEVTKTFEKRVEFLREGYMPTLDCIESGFKCDYELDDNTNQCPCEWAMSKERILEHTSGREQ